ncbi:aminotransferase class III-fold pyridoxal phosphate-dependent enzyme [Agarivorans sp. B2Z047]|uniref:aminotransferase family protein n=1 Tax=Agarivorans sp. B2Z047 TaxID=2652721 RepID=UPI00128E5688|nr:aminotransferase class III-fold pyridoxal phosphate-dependent enzyme [Agarivorans sp. B2Z047]MPW29932.1 aminotransferase class III-fold pyridoxal phosphate-dependent enzyme [Agarivorans sp. B2Z047]UQN43499.1 aminotransferase class III-fold pyridoxal phosphate-dependent enzyme [Agarivorans sp. B2Z047]
MSIENTAVIEQDRKHVWHHLNQHSVLKSQDPMVMVKGEGSRVWDAKGNSYLDASSGGVWCVNVGYGRSSIAEAVSKQLTELNFFASSAGTVPAAEFAEKLLAKMPGMSRVYYASSGSEANEKAFKIVRQIAHLKYGGKKHKILYRERDYHGSTIAALSATGQEERRKQYGPFAPGFVEFPHCCEYRSQFGDVSDYGVRAAKELEKAILQEGPDTVGAVILEPITAGGGVITPPEGYWPTIMEICKKYNVLLHIDEVVCGLGRTGEWFGYQHYGIKPDIVTLAKGVASSYAAISCTVTTEEVFNEFMADSSDREAYFRDISTFAGCTAGPAAALENLRILEQEELVHNSKMMGDYLLEGLIGLQAKHPIIGDVRGKGLLLGIELVSDQDAKTPVDESVAVKVAGMCMAKGLIIGRTNRSFASLNNTLCLCPVLTLSKQEADFIVTTIDEVLAKLEAS